ncbi:uncharacterized protein LOC120350817 [Nilaparvata lugens]|uniref:uncharacterized protein LOC120350817 n=1 Tax=Nilaparvata lugens TaxID=108931 RepID=UPI00193D00D6|nr:uncharacterized protein LOC120350817 [Nilaparvata lugens]
MDEDAIKKAHRARGLQKAKITRIHSYIENNFDDTNNIDYDMLKVKLEDLNTAFQCYDEIQLTLEMNDEKEEVDRFDIEDIYATLRAKMRKLLESRYANLRMIASNHSNLILNIPAVSKESATELASFIDRVSSNLHALKAFQDLNYAEFILIHFLCHRLDTNTAKAWEMSLKADQFPSINDFISFLEKRRQILENTSHSLNDICKERSDKSQTQKHSASQRSQSQSYHVNTQHADKICLFCKENHALYLCNKFNQVSISERVAFVKSNKLCFNCMRTAEHHAKECTSSNRCRSCNGNHHTLLHFKREEYKEKEMEQESGGSYCSVKTQRASKVLLATAIISVEDKYGRQHKCRALLDAGSQVNFVCEALAQQLGIKREAANLCISGINKISTSARQSVSIKISSNHRPFTRDILCFVLPHITGDLPLSNIDVSSWGLPNNIVYADEEFQIASKPQILLGAEIYYEVLLQGRFDRGPDYPKVIESILGWFISRKLPEDSNENHADNHVKSFLVSSATDVQKQLQKFWEMEQYDEPQCRSKEDEYCEEFFSKTTKRDDDGHFVVRLPRRANHRALGDSLMNAENRFLKMEKKLSNNEILRENYVKFMHDYEDLGHMRVIQCKDLIGKKHQEKAYYLPHHVVIKESSSTTKYRVVFDASAKGSNGVSLNSILMTGPTIQQDISSIILRFRTHLYVMTSDITKMYRMIKVHPDDYHLQTILWRDNPHQDIKHYQLTTLTYGTAPAAFLSTRCLAELAEENKQEYPHAAHVIKNDFYVDDLLTGGDDLDTVKALQREVADILYSAGFMLHKWCANDKQLLESVPKEKREQNLSIKLEEAESIKTLGLIWNHERDILNFDINIDLSRTNYTKRMVLSTIASIYDVLGILGPFIVMCKIFMQDLWKYDLKWDDKLPPKLHEAWNDIIQEIPKLRLITVPRFVKASGSIINVQINGFSDASEKAYGACVYLRTVDVNGSTCIRLLSSKS